MHTPIQFGIYLNRRIFGINIELLLLLLLLDNVGCDNAQVQYKANKRWDSYDVCSQCGFYIRWIISSERDSRECKIV